MIAIRDLAADRGPVVGPVPGVGPGDPRLIPRFGKKSPDQNPGPVHGLVEDRSPGLGQDRKMGKKI